MVYELLSPQNLASFPDIFAGLPPRTLGLLMWVAFTSLALLHAARAKPGPARRVLGLDVPLWLAAGIYTGLFIINYDLVDEVAINLEHSYNLFHYGKFSMSSERWIEGTVESVYYLLHTPFAWSQHSLIVANYVISLLVGLLHLPLVAWTIDPAASPRKRTLLMSAFALSLPLSVMFSSGFGNGLVSLVFLAAIGCAINGRERRSLIFSGILPLLRPDALLLSAVNAGVIGVSRLIVRKRLLSLGDLPPLALAALSAAVYYSFYRVAFGNWIPTPVFFKTIRGPMFQMTNKTGALRDIIDYFSHGPHAIALLSLVLIGLTIVRVRSSITQDRRLVTFALYALATLPLLFFYSVTHHTLRDYSFSTYQRYWIAFELTFQLVLLAAFANLDFHWETPAPARRLSPHTALFGLVILGMLSIIGNFTTFKPDVGFIHPPGRRDNVFAGAFTQRYMPSGLSIATTEMDTFGLMIERPVIDLWGYTTPAIAHSKVCNADHVRSNSRYFLQTKPDIYWPYWFTEGMRLEQYTGNFDNVEESFAESHHTSTHSNMLGDMTQVFTEYDVVVIRTPHGHLAYLTRSPAGESLRRNLLQQGFKLARTRPLDMARFRRLYDSQKVVTYPCPN
jgi:hypothetical protein